MKILKICLSIFAIHTSFIVAAAPIVISDRDSFENLGNIAEFQDFESFNPDDFTDFSGDFVDGSMTYTSPGTNLIVGANTFIAPISNTLSMRSAGTPLTGDIAGNFSMFALDVALNLAENVVVTLTLNTNLGDYLFDISPPRVQEEQLFQGFVLNGDEFFTGFSFSEVDFVHIDNVTLGNVVEASSPSTIGAFLLGMFALGALSRKVQAKNQAS
jgi:hypothetical protein